MLSYADRAKSKPRVSHIPPDSSSSTAASTASALSSDTNPTSSVYPNGIDVVPLKEQVPQSLSKEKENVLSTNQEATDISVVVPEPPHLTENSSPSTLPAPAAPKPNVWTQRAQARASAASSPVTPAFSSSSSQTAAPPAGLSSSKPPKIISEAIVHPEENISPSLFDNEAWPEVGPSTGTPSRGQSKVRPHLDKEKDNEASHSKKAGEKTKWVAISPAELQAAADEERTSRSNRSQRPLADAGAVKNSVASNKARQTDTLSTLTNLRPGSTSGSPHGSPRFRSNVSRSHSQLPSAHNSPKNVMDGVELPKFNGNGRETRSSSPRYPNQRSARNSRRSTPRNGRSPLIGFSNDIALPTVTNDADTLVNSNSTIQPNVSSNPMPSSKVPDFTTTYPYYSQNVPYGYPSYGYLLYPPPIPSGNGNQFAQVPFPPSVHPYPPNTLPPAHELVANANLPSEDQSPAQPVSAATPAKPNEIHALPSRSFAPPPLSSAASPQHLPLNVLSRAPPRRSAPGPIVSVHDNSSIRGGYKSVVKNSSRKIIFGSLISSASNSPHANPTTLRPDVPRTMLAGEVKHVDDGQSSDAAVSNHGQGLAIGFDASESLVDITARPEKAVSNNGGSRAEQHANKWTFGSVGSHNTDETVQEVTHSLQTASLTPVSPSGLGLVTGPKATALRPNGTDHPISPLASSTSSLGPQEQSQSSNNRLRSSSQASPTSVSDFEVQDFGYGFGAPYVNDLNSRSTNENVRPFIPPYPDVDPASYVGYYPPPHLPPQQPVYPYGYRPTWQDNEPVRWRNEDGFSPVSEPESSFSRERIPPRGMGRRGRVAGRGFGRGLRGGWRGRDRDFQPHNHHHQQQHDGPRIPPYRSPVNPMSEQPYPVDYYYPPPPTMSAFPPQVSSFIPEPVTIPAFPLDPLRLSLLGQLEYYFSAQNLQGDKFLRNQMDSNGWVAISMLASFNRIRTLTAGAATEFAAFLVRDVLALSSLLEVSFERDQVRLRDGRWKEYMTDPNLPLYSIAQASNVGTGIEETKEKGKAVADANGEGGEGEDTEDEDIEFVMGKDGSPAKRNWSIPVAQTTVV